MAEKSQAEIDEKIKNAAAQVKVGGKYYHYKSSEKHYEVIGIGIIESTEEPAIIYKPLYIENGPLWIRTLAEFTSSVEWEGEIRKRFTPID